MPIVWDDLHILRALDALEASNRAYHGNGEDLLVAAADGQPIDDADRVAFSRQLIMLKHRGRLTFEQQQFGSARLYRPQEREYPQSLSRFQLTETGRDRAKARVVYEGFPDPDEDDGRVIPGLILRRIAEMLADYYSPRQLPVFLRDSGVLDRASPASNGTDMVQYVYTELDELATGDAEQRRILRQFLARYVNGGLDLVLTPADQTAFTQQLARAGWHVRKGSLVIGERLTTVIAAPERKPSTAAVDPKSAIFVVHGHALDRVQTVSRFLQQITNGNNVIVLHEQANRGQTLLEKFETNAEKAAHAVVLLTADDLGRSVDSEPADEMPRGRQNVVLELGFFFGKLGREHVTVLRDPDVEEPSDVKGLVYVPFDKGGSWRFTLAKELKASGLDADLNLAI